MIRIVGLPRHVRCRLWIERRVDRLCCWLCDHGCEDVAVLIWQAFGMWGQ